MYKKSTISLLATLAIGLNVALSSVAWAKDPNMAVQTKDRNGDGKVSFDEWDKPEFVFNKIDFNGDGYLTAQEFAKKWGIPMSGGGSNARSVADAGSLDDTSVIIADVHMHPHPNNHPIDQLTWMNRNGVKWAGLGEMLGGRSVRENYRQTLGNRYIPFGGQSALNQIFFKYGVSGLEDENNPMFRDLMTELKQDFDSGKLKGIGEVFGDNSNGNPKSKIKRKTNVYAPTYKGMIDLVAKYGGALSIHVDWNRDSIAHLESLADYNTDGNIIWAHCGGNTHANDVRKVLQRHGNIYCDLSARHKPKLTSRIVKKKPHQEIFTSYSLNSGWKDLIEEMPDRFMVGTDTKGGAKYDKGISNIRNGLLANLSQETAEKVAYKNAQRLLNLH
ncbi:MAG: amidohydrolase family protein [Candidatus Thioglobus sp.]|nr:amidohydrolase family protein [Candidatus Thioglobus pontius]MBL6984583.1 amidohydrolase family protein [Candidatus Thioglobus sp.]